MIGVFRIYKQKTVADILSAVGHQDINQMELQGHKLGRVLTVQILMVIAIVQCHLFIKLIMDVISDKTVISETIGSNNSFTVYPNSSSGVLTVTLGLSQTENKAYTVEVYNLLGIKLLVNQINPNVSNSITFDLSDLTTGVYFAKLIGSDGEMIGAKSFIINKN